MVAILENRYDVMTLLLSNAYKMW